jgi:hypothetical protein
VILLVLATVGREEDHVAKRRTELEEVAGLASWCEEDARVVLDAWQRSGQTIAAFARNQGVGAKRLARWARRLHAEGAQGVEFYPVQVVSREPSQGKSTIELVRGAWRVRVAPGFAAEDLRQVLDVLEAGG